MGDTERRFTERQSVFLRTNLLPTLAINQDTPDGQYILSTVATLMDGPKHPSRARAFVTAFKQLIAGENLPLQQRPKALHEYVTLHGAHTEYNMVDYVLPCSLDINTYFDPNRPSGDTLILEELIQEGRPDRRGQRAEKKIRCILTHRVTSEGNTVEYQYMAASSINDPQIYVSRVKRYLLIGTGPSVRQQKTVPGLSSPTDPLTWPHYIPGEHD